MMPEPNLCVGFRSVICLFVCTLIWKGIRSVIALRRPPHIPETVSCSSLRNIKIGGITLSEFCTYFPPCCTRSIIPPPPFWICDAERKRNFFRISFWSTWRGGGLTVVLRLFVRCCNQFFYMENKFFALNSLLEENGFTFLVCVRILTWLGWNNTKNNFVSIEHLFYYCFRLNWLCIICKYCTSMIYGWN